MGLHIFEREVRRLIIGGVNPRGLITRIEKRALEQVTGIAVLIKIPFYCIYWFFIKPQNVIVNLINLNTFEVGLISRKAYNLMYIYFLFTVMWTYDWKEGRGGGL